MKPLVSILISVKDQLSLTKKCIACIEKSLKSSISYEVLIANDASVDGTEKYLESLPSPYRVYHQTGCSHGFAKNNNWLAREAKGDYLLFLNNDAFVKGDWLTPMLHVFEKYSSVGFVGNVQKLHGTQRYDHMGVVFSPLGNPRHYGQGFFHRPFKGEVRKWSAVTAACCLIKRDLFNKQGGFDENFLNGCEDVDLCIRLNRAGYNHYVVHDSVIDHVKGATTGRKDRNEENFALLMEKWGEDIRGNESVQDSLLHARTYLFRPFFKPLGTNIKKFLDALLIFTRLRKLSSN
jgi:GT2 family glycosyltransferase